jgi:hypothetical protein
MSENISPLTISVAYESDESCPVWIIFYCLNRSRDIKLIELEVDLTIEFFVSRTLMSYRDTTSTIASCMSLDRVRECSVWSTRSDLFIGETCHEATRRGIWFEFLDWHGREDKFLVLTVEMRE